MENDDNETWVRFSEVGINARMRNALELFALMKEKGALSAPVCGGEEGNRSGLERLPATLTGWGAGVVAGLASDTDREELVTATGTEGSEPGQVAVSAPACTGASADWVKHDD